MRTTPIICNDDNWCNLLVAEANPLPGFPCQSKLITLPWLFSTDEEMFTVLGLEDILDGATGMSIVDNHNLLTHVDMMCDVSCYRTWYSTFNQRTGIHTYYEYEVGPRYCIK